MRPTLAGLRVLEIGHFVAAPFCTRLLADLGADVIKIEPPRGDPARQWGEQVDGRSLWWSVHARNKRSLKLDLKLPKARQIVLDIVAECDVVVENFRPGHLDVLGLGPDTLRSVRQDLIVAHVSGYGQTGPGRDRAAFGAIGEAVGGLRYLSNHAPGQSELPPVRVGVSIGDSIAGLYSAFGIMAALWQRDSRKGDGQARTIDVALTESILSMMEGMLPEYGKLGKIKHPSGGALSTAAPTNAYQTRDDSWVLIAANSTPLFARLAALASRPDWLVRAEFADNAARVRNCALLDSEITQWSCQHDAATLLALLAEADIPSSKVYTSADCATDEQYLAREMVRQVEDANLGALLHPGVVPHIPESPGTVRWTGPDLGADTDEILIELAGLSRSDVDALRHEGVV